MCLKTFDAKLFAAYSFDGYKESKWWKMLLIFSNTSKLLETNKWRTDGRTDEANSCFKQIVDESCSRNLLNKNETGVSKLIASWKKLKIDVTQSTTHLVSIKTVPLVVNIFTFRTLVCKQSVWESSQEIQTYSPMTSTCCVLWLVIVHCKENHFFLF